jgi:hypothetical protein
MEDIMEILRITKKGLDLTGIAVTGLQPHRT